MQYSQMKGQPSPLTFLKSPQARRIIYVKQPQLIVHGKGVVHPTLQPNKSQVTLQEPKRNDKKIKQKLMDIRQQLKNLKAEQKEIKNQCQSIGPITKELTQGLIAFQDIMSLQQSYLKEDINKLKQKAELINFVNYQI